MRDQAPSLVLRITSNVAATATYLLASRSRSVKVEVAEAVAYQLYMTGVEWQQEAHSKTLLRAWNDRRVTEPGNFVNRCEDVSLPNELSSMKQQRSLQRQ